MEGGQREGDLRVPIISALFCLLVLAGGVFLILFVFLPDLSQPWYPIVAFLLIGSPWIFWLMTYMYTCIKACCRPGIRIEDRQMSKRTPRTASTHTAMNRAGSSRQTSQEQSTGDGRHVHFGEVVVVQDDNNSGQNGGGESSTSSKESERPLTLSVSS